MAKFRQNVARFRLYRLRFLQENTRFALLITKVGFDIESEMRLTLAESVEAERLTGSGKWAEHAPHANLTVVRPLLARAPLTAKLISRAT